MWEAPFLNDPEEELLLKDPEEKLLLKDPEEELLFKDPAEELSVSGSGKLCNKEHRTVSKESL